MSYNKTHILSEIFGISCVDAEMLINNISNLYKNINPNNNYNYETELRFIDFITRDINQNLLKGCSLKMYNNFDLSDFHEVGYSDDIYISYESVFPNIIRGSINQKDYCKNIQENIKHRLNYIKKTNIISIETKFNSSNRNTRQITSNIPVCIKLNLEDNINDKLFELSEIRNFQRRQRISYKSHKPLLCNWRIDKTVRFFTNDPKHKKLLYNKLTKENVINPEMYDLLDIEFEYIGEYSNFEESFYKLFEVIYYNKFKLFNIKYNELNTYLTKKFNINLYKIFIPVNIVTNDFIQNEDINEYVYEEKYDGDRVILIMCISNGVIQIFEYTKLYFKEIYYNITERKDNTLYILDSEKIINDNKPLYCLFDCLIYDNENLNEMTYKNRLSYCDKFVNEFNDIINILCVPCYSLNSDSEEKRIKKWKSLLFTINTRFESINPELKNVKIDGLVLHKNKCSFMNGEIYKLKNSFMMTIDFKLMWIPEKSIFYLYLIGNVEDLIRNTPMNNHYSKSHFGYSLLEETKNVYMLFDTPFIPKAYEFEPILKWYNEGNRSNKLIQEPIKDKINNLITKIIRNPTEYNNKIVEMTLYRCNDCFIWLPVRERFDKEFPNGYKVGLSTVECIYNRLSPSYCNKEIKYIDYNESYEYVLKKYIDNKDNKLNILWNTLNYKSVNNIIDNCLINDLYILSNEKSVLVKTCKEIYNNTNKHEIININCIHYENNENKIINIYNKLLKTSFINRCIDVYIETQFRDYVDILDEYIDFLNNVISSDGYYVIISTKKLQKNIRTIFNSRFNLINKENERIINDDINNILYINIFKYK